MVVLEPYPTEYRGLPSFYGIFFFFLLERKRDRKKSQLSITESGSLFEIYSSSTDLAVGTRKHRKKFGAPLLAGPFLNYGSIHFLLWHFAFKRNLSSRETLRERACVCASTTPLAQCVRSKKVIEIRDLQDFVHV